MALASEDKFYGPGRYWAPQHPKIMLRAQNTHPPSPDGTTTIPLSLILTVANNIQAAVKAQREGQVSASHGDPMEFILKMAEDLRTLAIKNTSV